MGFKRGDGPRHAVDDADPQSLAEETTAPCVEEENSVEPSGTQCESAEEISRGTPPKYEKTSPPQYEEYFVSLDRTSGSAFGLKMLSDEGNSMLLVEGINGGLAQMWNESHPELQIQKGDILVEANGVSGAIEDVIAECKKEALIQLK